MECRFKHVFVSLESVINDPRYPLQTPASVGEYGLGAATAALLLAVSCPAGGLAATPQLQIRGAAMRLVVVPERRKDIRIFVLATHSTLPIRVRRLGARMTITGDVTRKVHGCGPPGRPQVAIWGHGVTAYSALPLVVARTPLDVKVIAGEAVFGTIGRSGSVELENLGCGSWTIANTRSRLRIEQAGSGSVRTGSAQIADLTVAGDGRIATGTVRGGLHAVSSGSGDVNVGQAFGAADLRVGGDGNVIVGGGSLGKLTASIAGSGDVRVRAVAQSLTASVTGAGNVDVAKVSGLVTRRIFGAGQIRVGR